MNKGTEKISDTQKIIDMMSPVWHDTEKAKQALNIYEAIGLYAGDLNTLKHGHFFGYVQMFSLDAVVLSISRIYETDDKKYKRNSLPVLVKYLIENQNTHLRNRELLTALGVKNILEIKDAMPTRDNDESLKKIFLYRHKKLAHREKLTEESDEQLKHLPSIEELFRLRDWAFNFCQVFADALTPGACITPSLKSGKMATYKVIAKLKGEELLPFIEDASRKERLLS